MHYIRFLKPPRLLSASSSTPLSISAKITVTTDLGESFLLANTSLVVALELDDGTSLLGVGKGREYVWTGRDGMRSLELVIPIPMSKGKRKMSGQVVRMLVRPKEEGFSVESFEKLLDNKDSDNGGCVVTVRSMAIDISSGANGGKAPGVGMAERVFSMGAGYNKRRVRIWEETGESIARHIWYAAWIWTGTSSFSLY